MSLLSFLKNAGAEIFGRGGKSEDESIREHVMQELSGKVEELKVGWNNGTVTLEGKADSQETKEKAILIAGNVKGVEQVNGEGIQVAAKPISTSVEFYTVEKGDSLSKIAQKTYGDSSKFNYLFEANREVIKDPNLIYPGQKLRVPELQQ